MAIPLRVLILEDRPADAELMLHELRRAGFDPVWERVDTEADYLSRLDPALDLILADYSLPQFDGVRALHLLQERGLDIPFIIVSGTIGEEVAVAAMREGAADYLFKDRLTRLGPAVEQALEQNRLRGEKRQAAEALRDREARLVKAQQVAHMGFLDWDLKTNELFCSDEVHEMYGVSREEVPTSPEFIAKVVHPDDMEYVQRNLDLAVRGVKRYDIDHRINRPDGKVLWVQAQAELARDADGNPETLLGTIVDITERKRAEEEIQRNYDTQAVVNSLLRLSLEDTPCEEILKRAVDLILSIPWLAFEPQGSIFLVEDDPEVLVMKAQKGLAEPLQRECARLPFGRCLCGRAALTREIQFADCLDDRHEIRYDGIPPHGHYCVPILSAGRTLGVMNTYLGEGHRRDQREERFLTAIANTLAGVIQRKRAEEQIRRQSAVLEAINEVFQETLTSKAEAEVAHTCLAVAEELTGSKFGFIGELNQEGLFDTIAISSPGWDACKMPDSEATVLTRNMEIRGIGRSVLREEKSRIVNDPASHPDRVGTPEGHPSITSFLGVPLKQAGRTIGMIGLANKESGYDLADQQAVEALSVAFVEALNRKRAEEGLRESEERYRHIFEQSLIGIGISSLDGKVVTANKAMQAITGYTAEELERINLADTYENIEDREALFEAISRGDGVVDFPVRLKRKDGTPYDALLSVSRMNLGGKDFLHTICQDVTARKRAERLLRALNEMALAMERALTPEEMFSAIARECRKLGFRCAVFMTDETQSRLLAKHWSHDARVVRIAEKLLGLKVETLSIPIETADIATEVVRGKKTVLVENAEELLEQGLPEPAKRLAGQLARVLKMPKTIPTPLIVEDKVIGVFAVQSGDLTEGDIPAISAFAHQIAAAWRKAQLMQDLETSLTEVQQAQEELQRTAENLRKTLGATIQAMAFTVETRDPYTAGHQRRVGNLARGIATEMGLSKEQIEGISMAAVIHDIGKITVPAEILSKPTRLTEHEFGIIRGHPEVGHDILKTIEFPWPIAQIIFQHHERMDSSGYPQELSGEEIILEARILGVADVVEAMASHRPYRPALGIDKALEEISQNRGVLYDPEVVDACLRLFAEKRFTFQ